MSLTEISASGIFDAQPLRTRLKLSHVSLLSTYNMRSALPLTSTLCADRYKHVSLRRERENCFSITSCSKSILTRYFARHPHPRLSVRSDLVQAELNISAGSIPTIVTNSRTHRTAKEAWYKINRTCTPSFLTRHLVHSS